MPDPLFATAAARAAFSSRARVARMLEFEAALAEAEAAVGVVPAAAAAAIAAQCRIERYDVAAIEAEAANAGNLAIPLVAALTRAVAAADAAASGWVHWGATSQDAIDTGLVLQLREALAAIDADAGRLVAALAGRAREHAATTLAGRTWLQQAAPVTLGLKLAASASAIARGRARLDALRRDALVLQFGGAVGTLAALGDRGLDVAAALAARLDLALPELPWHTQRDRLGEVAAALALTTATVGKLARDLALLAQTEVGEACERATPGRGGSSTLPQKRNPVGASIAIAAAVRVPGLAATMLTAAIQEHERGLGGWPAEWETLPEIAMLTAAAVAAMADVAAGLEVDAARMAANLELSRGLVFAEAAQMALAPALGRERAHRLVAKLCARAQKDGGHLRSALAADREVAALLDEAALDRVFDARRYLGATPQWIERALAGLEPARRERES